jgi:hypothetical protein
LFWKGKVFIILNIKREVAITKIDKEKAELAKARKKHLQQKENQQKEAIDCARSESRQTGHDSIESEEAEQYPEQYEAIYQINIGKVQSGESFGEVAFLSVNILI